MGLSTNTTTYAGGAQTFAVNFALGFLSRADVQVRVNAAVDGSGDPVYTSFSWIDDSAISVIPTLTIGDTVEVLRTVSKTALSANFAANTDVTPANLDISAKQGLMVYQELIDGRVEGTESPIVAGNRAEAAALAAEADAALTAADRVQTGLDAAAAALSAANVSIDQGVSTTDSPTFVNGTFTGNITPAGTVDGRDLAIDGAKLDAVEALADVTDTTNVNAAGALMDSELTDIASVKALNQGLATTDSPTFDVVTATSFAGDGSAITGLDDFTYTGSAPLFACRAWGNVKSDASVDGGNFAAWDVSTHIVTFTTAMPHANYAVVVNGPVYGNCFANTLTTTSFTVNQISSGGNVLNPVDFEFTVVC
jgi:hypothetical protein